MSFADYVAVSVQLYCVGCHCLTLHVSAYMAILKGAVYIFFYFHMPEVICFAGFCLFSHVVTLCTFPSVGWVKYEVLILLITIIINNKTSYLTRPTDGNVQSVTT
jgi:hypothetical protein